MIYGSNVLNFYWFPVGCRSQSSISHKSTTKAKSSLSLTLGTKTIQHPRGRANALALRTFLIAETIDFVEFPPQFLLLSAPWRGFFSQSICPIGSQKLYILTVDRENHNSIIFLHTFDGSSPFLQLLQGLPIANCSLRPQPIFRQGISPKTQRIASHNLLAKFDRFG